MADMEKDNFFSAENKTTPPSGNSAASGSEEFSDEKLSAFQEQKDHISAEKIRQVEVLHSKTHQDLINAAYKAAEKLGIAPWVLLRAADWGTFTDDRGKKYTGPAIDDLAGLDDAQKNALKEVLGL
jgi:hypothetical protein